MGLIASISGLDRDIYLSAETVGATINPIDIYKEYRTLRRNSESLRKFLPFMAAKGFESKGGGAYTERYVVLLGGARFVPYNVSHTLTIVGTVITDSGLSGINCFDRRELSSTTNVNINYVPPQVEVVVVTHSTGSGLSSAQDATLTAALAAAQAGAWTQAIEGSYTAAEVMRLLAAAMAGQVSGAAGNSITFRGLDDTTERIIATVDANGNRTAVTRNVL